MEAIESNGAPSHQIHVAINEQAKALADLAGIAFQRIEETARASGGIALESTLLRIYNVRWFDDSKAVFVGGLATKFEPSGQGIRIDEITVDIVLSLHRSLPSGRFSSEASTNKVLQLVALSGQSRVAEAHAVATFSK